MNALVAQYAPATVRISGPPNSSFLVGYPGISATLVSFLLVCADVADANLRSHSQE